MIRRAPPPLSRTSAVNKPAKTPGCIPPVIDAVARSTKYCLRSPVLRSTTIAPARNISSQLGRSLPPALPL